MLTASIRVTLEFSRFPVEEEKKNDLLLKISQEIMSQFDLEDNETTDADYGGLGVE